jgi:hypothetical protein
VSDTPWAQRFTRQIKVVDLLALSTAEALELTNAVIALAPTLRARSVDTDGQINREWLNSAAVDAVAALFGGVPVTKGAFDLLVHQLVYEVALREEEAGNATPANRGRARSLSRFD